MASAAGIEDEDGITSINITPLVDVFLVLLIIVMISSSLLEHREIPVSIPKAAHAGEEAPKASGLSMTLDKKVFLDGIVSDSVQVTALLREKISRDSTHQVLIAADQGLLYQDVIRLLDWVRSAGVHKYALKVSRQE